ADLAHRLAAEGHWIWVVGGPGEKELAGEIADGADIRDLTGPDLRNAILALAAATVAVSNDSGLLHVPAALRTPPIRIFGPLAPPPPRLLRPPSPGQGAPPTPSPAVIETAGEQPCRPCHKPVCRLGHHRCMRDISVDRVAMSVRQAIGPARGDLRA